MKNLSLLLGCVVILMACNNSVTEEKVNSTALVDSIQIADNQYCYENAGNGDSVRLQIDQVGMDVSGELLYAIRGKDRNEGTVQGEWLGDTLLVDYLFQSEGSLSSRQLVFLKKDSLLIEGYGASEEKDGKLKFINRAELKFGSGIQLKQSDCKQVGPGVGEAVSSASSGATSSPVSGKGEDQGSEVLFMFRWELKELNGNHIEVDKRAQFFLLFTPGQVGRVSGKGGCNRLTGTFELVGERGMKFGAIASTKMACPEMEQETLFLKALAEANQWKIIDNQLFLLKDGSNLAVFQSVTVK